MRAYAIALLCTVVSGAAVGCTGGEPKTVVETRTVTVTAAAPTPAPVPARVPQALRFGVAAVVSEVDAQLTITVLSYTHSVKGVGAPSASQGGDTWAAVEVKACNTTGPTTEIGQFPWTLAYGDATRSEVTGSNGGDLPKPEYAPGITRLLPGDCARGKIPFPVMAAKRPERVIYTSPTGQDTIAWTVPPA